jgi:two-component system, NarL family, invasion response regulator UvrY
MIRTLVVDDHKLVREGLVQILGETPDISVVGEAGNGREALEIIRHTSLDVVLLDVSMPDMDGLATISVIKHEHPRLAVLVLSMYPEEQYAVRFLKAGAAGYLTKASASDELLDAIRKVAGGGHYVTRALAERLVVDLGSGAPEGGHAALSDREFQTLRLIVAGRTVTEIADELSLSVKTISTYRSRVLAKLGLHSTAELVRYALEQHLV